jgi:hypothetical protein
MTVMETTGAVRFLPISIADIGNTELIAGVAGFRVRVIGLVLTSDAVSSFKFSDGSDLTGEFSLAANTPFVWPTSVVAYLSTGAGNGLSVDLDAGDIKGFLVYQMTL